MTCAPLISIVLSRALRISGKTFCAIAMLNFRPSPNRSVRMRRSLLTGSLVVNRIYATTRCDQNPFPVDEDHTDIVKPAGKDADIYKWAQSRIQQTSDGVRIGIRPTPSTASAISDVRSVIGQLAYPVFWVFNPSGVVARQPKYQLNLWNLTVPDPYPKSDVPRLNLRIPVKLMQDYILPGKGLGPWRIVNLSPNEREVGRGHVLFGTASVQCINCERIRYYWINLKIGESGWIAEIPEDEQKTMNKRFEAVLHAGEKASLMVDQVVPLTSREIVE